MIAQALSSLDSAPVRRLAGAIHLVLTVAVVAFLAARLAHLGIAAVVAALPRNPVYYALFAVGYLALPLSEFVLYRRLLDAPIGLRVFLRKRVFNEALIDYSGEGYFFAKLRQILPGRDRQIAARIKDVNLLSGVVSNTATMALLLVMAAIGQLGLLTGSDARYPTAVMVSAGLGTSLLVGLALFGRHVISAPARDARFIMGVHAARLLFTLLAQIAQWEAILPDVSLARWCLFLTIWLLVTRIPFLPNRDLVLGGVGLTLSGLIDAPQSTVAGLFTAGAVLPLLAHAAVMALTSFGDRARPVA